MFAKDLILSLSNYQLINHVEKLNVKNFKEMFIRDTLLL